MIDPLSRRIFERSPPHGVIILMYHSTPGVRQRSDWPWALSIASFREQLEFLNSAGYETPTVSEFIANPGGFTGRTAIITFDDGYEDNLFAVEELVKQGMKGTFYVVAGAMGKKPHWPWSIEGRPVEGMLSAAEIRGLQQAGMEIGSHTLNHARLPSASDDQLYQELIESKSTLEDAIGQEITAFAYPYGLWDLRSEFAVKEVGYQSACLTRTGWGFRDHDPWRLRRLTVLNGCTLNVFARMLALATDEVSWASLIKSNIQAALKRNIFK